MNGLSDKVNISTGYLSTSSDIFGWPSGSVILSAQRYTAYGVPSENLEVVLQRQAGPSEIILAGAHYDLVSGSPGADDNASM